MNQAKRTARKRFLHQQIEFGYITDAQIIAANREANKRSELTGGFIYSNNSRRHAEFMAQTLADIQKLREKNLQISKVL